VVQSKEEGENTTIIKAAAVAIKAKATKATKAIKAKATKANAIHVSISTKYK
jgi:hypothetical protein